MLIAFLFESVIEDSESIFSIQWRLQLKGVKHTQPAQLCCTSCDSKLHVRFFFNVQFIGPNLAFFFWPLLCHVQRWCCRCCPGRRHHQMPSVSSFPRTHSCWSRQCKILIEWKQHHSCNEVHYISCWPWLWGYGCSCPRNFLSVPRSLRVISALRQQWSGATGNVDHTILRAAPDCTLLLSCMWSITCSN